MKESEKFFDNKIKEIAKTKNVLNVGGGRPWQKEMKKYKDLFKNVNYKTLDKVAEYQPDIVGDICSIPLDNNSTEAVICHSVLEHVENPFKAIEEIYRILTVNGQCLVVLPFLYPYHAEVGYYGDYYRFTEDGVKCLFHQFSQIEICKIGGLFETMVNLVPVKLIRKSIGSLAKFLDKFFKTKNQTSGFVIYAVK